MEEVVVGMELVEAQAAAEVADALRVADAAEGLQREEEQWRRHTEELYEAEQEKAGMLRKLLSAREREIDVSYYSRCDFADC